MQIDLFSRCKRRAADMPGDDIALVVPGVVYAVLDGATDPTGCSYHGESSGRLAARSAGQALLRLLLTEGPEVALDRIGAALSKAVAEAAQEVGAVHPPSTTLAAAIQGPEGFRLVLIGDSGIRINGTRLVQNDKLIDRVSAQARLATRACLAPRLPEADALEASGRKVSFGGLDAAVRDGVLSQDEAAGILSALQAQFGPQLGAYAGDLDSFLRGGIRVQPRYANDPDHPFGFASINATAPRGFGMSDLRIDMAELASLEIFTDGYFGLPKGTTVTDWEARFAEIEAEDPHKVSAYPEVKGSTATEFSDDRTVLCLHRAG